MCDEYLSHGGVLLTRRILTQIIFFYRAITNLTFDLSNSSFLEISIISTHISSCWYFYLNVFMDAIILVIEVIKMN